MIRQNKVKQILKQGGNVIGTFVKFSDPSIIEILGLIGFDFFVVDNEHVAMNRENMVNLIRTADNMDIVPVIRVRENRAVEILQVLDSGAFGVQIPQVNTKEDALSVVKSAKYAPIGDRGYAPTHRAAAYGFMDPVKYANEANENTLIVCYCETVEAMDNLDSILTVDEIDVIFIGPFDLAQSLGLTGQGRHPKVLECMDVITEKVKAAGKAVGTIASNPEDAKRLMDKGIQFITISSDQGMVATLGKQFMKELGKENKIWRE